MTSIGEPITLKETPCARGKTLWLMSGNDTIARSCCECKTDGMDPLARGKETGFYVWSTGKLNRMLDGACFHWYVHISAPPAFAVALPPRLTAQAIPYRQCAPVSQPTLRLCAPR